MTTSYTYPDWYPENGLYTAPDGRRYFVSVRINDLCAVYMREENDLTKVPRPNLYKDTYLGEMSCNGFAILVGLTDANR